MRVKSKAAVTSTSLRRSATTVDGAQREQPQRPINDHLVTVISTAGDKPAPRTQFHIRHPPQTSAGGRSTPDQRAAASTRGARHADGRGRGGRPRPGPGAAVVDHRGGSDSDSRRRDERVRFAADTVVQTGDGRTLIVDDSAAADRARPSPSKRSLSISGGGGTLPARLRGPAAARRVMTEVEPRDPARHQSAAAPRGLRPRSAVYDDDAAPGVGGGGGGFTAMAVRTASVPQSINVIHRGSGANAALTRTREVSVVTQPAPAARRVVDHRDPTRHHRR